jgi:hypothetical protein
VAFLPPYTSGGHKRPGNFATLPAGTMSSPCSTLQNHPAYDPATSAKLPFDRRLPRGLPASLTLALGSRGSIGQARDADVRDRADVRRKRLIGTGPYRSFREVQVAALQHTTAVIHVVCRAAGLSGLWTPVLPPCSAARPPLCAVLFVRDAGAGFCLSEGRTPFSMGQGRPFRSRPGT